MRFSFLLALFVCAFGACDNRTRNDMAAGNSDSLRKEVAFYIPDVAKADWFTVEGRMLCDEKNKETAAVENEIKYGAWFPYNINQRVSRDSANISFDFISECCQKFVGGVIFSSDTLVLQYGFPKEIANACYCYCDYRMIYKIRKTKTWSAIRIVNLQGYKKKTRL